IHTKLPWPQGWRINLTLDDIVQWLICGNPIVATIELFSGSNVSANVPIVLPRYLIFHGVVAAVLPAWSIWRLRGTAAREAGRAGRKGSRWTRPWFSTRPRVWASPMLWKELFVGSGMKLTPLVRLIFACIVALLFVGSFALLWY